MAFIYDLLDQWNAAGTTFTGIKLNVTDTASAAGSLLMDLQVGGVGQFRVSKAGTATLAGGVTFGDGSSIANTSIGLIQNRITVASTSTYAFSSTAGAFGTPDIILARDAANTLAQRNGVNAQAFNLYNTYTDASNYERGALRYDGTVLGLFSQALGTGTVRNIQIGGTSDSSSTNMFVGVSSRLVRFRHSGTNYFEVNTNSGEIRLTIDRTLSQLTATPAVGMIARVTDATAPVVGSTVTGGGAAAALCWYNGTNWTVIGV